MLSTSAVVIALLAPSDQSPPLEINELVLAPVAGAPIVELTNVGVAPVDSATAQLVVGNSAEQLPSVLLGPGAFVRVHVGVSGANSPSDLFVPTLANPAPNAGSVAVYVASPGPATSQFLQDPNNVADFVQWGAPFQLYSTVAEAARVWFFANTFVPAPVSGESMAWDGQGNQSMDWFRDTSPILGGTNVQPTAGVSQFGNQCTPAAAGPRLSAESPPALGNRDFRVDFWTQSINQPGILFIGSETTTRPVFGGTCSFHVDQIFSQIPFTASPSGSVNLPIPVPELPVLIGAKFVFGATIANGFGLGPFGIDLSPALVVEL